MQKEVLQRIKNAIAASSGKRCDTMAVLAFDEMTIKGCIINILDTYVKWWYLIGKLNLGECSVYSSVD